MGDHDSSVILAAARSRGLRHAVWFDLLDGMLTLADAVAMNRYLWAFVSPSETRCPGCLKPWGGILGTFTYSLTHGEGRCSACGYPARADHYDFGPVKSLRRFILAYHPDGLSVEPR